MTNCHRLIKSLNDAYKNAVKEDRSVNVGEVADKTLAEFGCSDELLKSIIFPNSKEEPVSEN